MENVNKKYLGAGLVCFAASLWGLDGIVLTPRLFKLGVPFVVFILHFVPFVFMSFLFGKREMKNIVALPKKDLFYYFCIALFGGSLGTLSIVKALFFVFMSFLFGKREMKNIVALPKKDLFYYFCIALFGGSLGTLSIVKALFLVNFQHLTVVTLLQKCQPIFALILARLILKEKLGKNFCFLTLLAMIGGYVMTFEFALPHSTGSDNILPACGLALLAAFSFGSSTVFGKRILTNSSFITALYTALPHSTGSDNILPACGLALLAAFSFGSSTVFGKRILTNSSFITALYTRFFFTSIVTFVFVLLSGDFRYFGQVTPYQWLIFVTIMLTSGSMAIMIYYRGLRYIDASVATICELAFPISSVVFDYIFNGNLLT